MARGTSTKPDAFGSIPEAHMEPHVPPQNHKIDKYNTIHFKKCRTFSILKDIVKRVS